jgi:septal ring-binding cell division protein DamX
MSKDDNEEGRGFMPSVFLVAAVAAVMVTGMVLKTSPPESPPPGAGSASPPASLPLGSAITPDLGPDDPTAAPPPQEPAPEPARPLATVPDPERATPPAIDPRLAKLAARVDGDRGRLAKARGRWTAQLLVACKPETVERVLGLAHGASGLYILPVQVKDDACFRVCYGTYATPEGAARASDLPKALRGEEKVRAVEIARVLP